MKKSFPSRKIRGLSYNLILIMILIYIVGFLSQAPYPGFQIGSDGYTIIRIFDPEQQGKLKPGDQLVSIDSILTFDYLDSLNLQYWDDLSQGDAVPITIRRDGELKQVSWSYTGKTDEEFIHRLSSPIWLGLFLWGLGMTAHLSIPTENTRALIVAYNFIFSAGFVSFFGPADFHFWYSAYLVLISEWLSIPVLILLPWFFPERIINFRSKAIRISLTAAFIILIAAGFVLEFLHPRLELSRIGIMIGLSVGIVLLLLRSSKQKQSIENIKIYLIFSLISYLITFVLLALNLAKINLPNYVETTLFLGILLCPISIFYTIWSRKLPKYHFRPNRYLAMTLYSTLVIFFLLLILMLFENLGEQLSTTTTILAAMLISLITIQAYPFFTAMIDRYVFRIPVATHELLQSFSKQLDRTKDTASISSLMGNLILPSLQVRQSALIELQAQQRLRLLDQFGIHDSQVPTTGQIQQLVDLGLRVVPPQTMRAFPREIHWIRVVLPLVFDDKLIGIWLLGQKDPNDMYDDTLVDLLQALAQQTTIALIHHRKSQRLTNLYKENIDRDEEERAQLARDLHDDTLNDLALLQRETNDPVLLTGITKIINSLRKTINGLRPEMLSYGLVTALRDLADGLNDRQTHTAIHVELDGEPVPISPKVEQHLYRIVQQACENALRHAHAHQIRILGIISDKAIHLTVIDDGIGFDTESMDFTELISNQHYGLAGMHERANIINASLTVQSNPDQGTRISIYWKNPQSS